MLIGMSAYSQVPTPKGFPFPFTNGYERLGWMQVDSGTIAAARDTTFRPKYTGTEIVWAHAGADTSKWMWNGRKWLKELKTGDAGNAVWGGITGLLSNQTDLQTALNTKIGLASLSATAPLAYNSATGVFSCPSCGSGGGGIGSLNGLTVSTQVFSIGTTGTDFNIVSAGSTHSFNFPTASASNRGLLSTTDWAFFNAKQPQLNGTGFVRVSGTTISYDNTVYYPNSNPSNFIALTSLSALAPVLYNNTTGGFSVDTSAGNAHLATQFYVLSHQSSGTITGAGNLSPLFTTAISSSTIVFTLSNAAGNSILGNNSGSSAPPTYFVPSATTLNGWFAGTIQPAITVTTTGSGVATFVSNVLNIPNNLQTLTYARNATNNTLALTGVSTQTLLIADATHAGLIDSAHYNFVDSLYRGLKVFNLFAVNGLTASGGDSIGLGGALIKNTILATAGFTMSMTGLPNKSTALSTDSVLIENAAGQIFKLPVPSGGGGAVASVSNSDGTITISPTTGSVVASLALAHPNTWTGAMAVNAAFSTNSTVNMTGITYTAGGANFDVAVFDTLTGKMWRQPYYQFDTTGFAGGATLVSFSGTKLTLSSPSGSPGGLNTYVQFNNSGAFGGAAGFIWNNSTLQLGVTSVAIGAATTARASLVLTSSSGTNVTSPTSGMLWWNGTNLNFRTGSTTVDLLAGGGGAVSSVSNSDGTITISPTTGSVVASLALAHPNTWTGAMAVNAAFSTNSTVNLTGVTYSAGGASFDVAVFDTLTGKMWRQPYYQFDTTGFAAGSTVVVFNGSKLTLGSSGTVNLATGVTGILPGANGGTGVANTGKTITLGGNFTTSGAFTTTLTSTANTSVTLPTSGTLYGTASGSITSAQLATSMTDETGTGANVFAVGATQTGTVFAAATTTVPNLTLTTSAGTNVTSPTSGMLWWNGTNLNFRTGSTTVNLLAAAAPGGSNTQVQFNNSSAFGGSASLTWDGSSLSSSNFIAVGGAIQLWKDATPSFAGNVGMEVPGNSPTNNLILSTFNGSTWSGRVTLFNGGNLVVGSTTDNAAFIQAGAATTTNASILLNSSAGTNVTSPTSGMLWWNGTNLNFRTGSTTVDLLAGGGGVTTIGAFSNTATNNALDISSVTLTGHAADATHPGMIQSSGSQTLAPSFTFNGPLLLAGSGNPRLLLSGNWSGAPSNHGSELDIEGDIINDAVNSGPVSGSQINTNTIFGATYTATNAVTYTNPVSTLNLDAPTASTNVTFGGGAYALYINSGNSFFNNNVRINGNLTQGSVTSIAAGTGAGGSPTVTIAGGDQGGLITVTTGTTPTASGTIATITYATAFGTASYPTLTPANAATALLSGTGMVFTTGSTGSFTLTAGTVALTTLTTYAWYYSISGK